MKLMVLVSYGDKCHMTVVSDVMKSKSYHVGVGGSDSARQLDEEQVK